MKKCLSILFLMLFTASIGMAGPPSAPPSTAVSVASETTAGKVELATDAETQTGTATDRAITPANLQACTATEARKGVAELATDAETVTGSATNLVTTPANITAKMAAPGAIGGTTPAAGTFTTVTGGLSVISDADGIVLTSADWGKFILMTGAAEVQLPDAGASDIGKYITVMARDALEQVEVALTDATELFVLQNGTALVAGNEANLATAAGSQATFVYLETGKWYVRGEYGVVTDGGAAD